ncbi:MAG: DUF362 domain-containing protein [Candidatus Omnitrophota bacterium]
MFKEAISRRRFIKFMMTALAALAGGAYLPRNVKAKDVSVGQRKKKGIKGDHDLVLAEGKDPYLMTVKAVEKMGGMGRFVKKGETVLVKPNMAWDRTVEQAANTNPLVVAALVELCYKAGAKRVNVFDRTCNAAERCYANSGIKKAAEEKNAKVYFVDDWNYVKAKFNYKSLMDGWPIYRDAVECDTLINVPVLKDHGLTNLTLSMKNFMGVCGGDRGGIHSDIGKRLVDLTDFMGPELTVIDAFRFLNAHGPSGGNLKDVVQMNKLIIATDPTLADTYAAKLAQRDPFSVSYIAEAARRNFGNSNIDSADIVRIAV